MPRQKIHDMLRNGSFIVGPSLQKLRPESDAAIAIA